MDQFSFNGSSATASGERVSRVSSVPPDPEVSSSQSRRVFSEAYKQRIVDEAERCRESGQIGALLRREGLYSSHLTNWRKQLAGPAKRRGRKPMDAALSEQMEANRKLLSEQRRLKRRLAQAEAIIEIQKKVSELLGIPLSSPESDEND